MNFIFNWRTVARRAHSMWAFYLSAVALIAPDVIYLLLGLDTSPRLWWFLALGLLVYGIWGRLKDQKIDSDTTRNPWAVSVVAVVAVLAIMTGDRQALGPPPDVEIAPSERVAMPVSDAVFTKVAVPFIGRWEGLRLQAYRDLVGVWTVCYGETKGVQPGDTYTRAECDAMLARESIAYRDGVHAAMTEAARSTLLPVGRDVAFASLAYNVGVGAAGRSTAVRRLNAGDVSGACSAIGWWNKAGGRVVRGLVNRRSEEIELCLRGTA